MEVTYNPDTNELEINGEKIDAVEFFDLLPKDMELARLYFLTARIQEIRREKIENLGGYQQRIIELAHEEREAREKQREALEEENYKKASAYLDLVKSIHYEKNTINEFRHAQKFLSNTEGRLMAYISKLEV
jgi:hypothetical protein